MNNIPCCWYTPRWLALGVVAFLALGGHLYGGNSDESAAADTGKGATSVYDFVMKNNSGQEVNLADYRGKVVLMVNVASQCGLTERNYSALEPLYQKYKDQGLRILAFPANEFGKQEPGTDAEIREFCNKYHVSFDLFSKVVVKGDGICPLYKFLTENEDQKIAGEVVWNFQKYLVGRDGELIARFHPKVNPDDPELVAAIEKALAEPVPESATR